MQKINVYLDNAATTQVDKKVIEKMTKVLKDSFGNPSSMHDFGVNARNEIESAREIIAKKINASPEQIIFTSGGSESNNLAIKGLASKSTKKHIITSKIEHPSVKETCKALEKQGYKVDYLSVDKEGFVNIEELKKKISKDTLLVSIIHGNNEIGTVQDIKTIGKICKDNSVLFHIDAVQSFLKEPIDVKEMNIDLMSLSGHKVHASKGIGVLFAKDKSKLQTQISGGGQEFNIRSGTENTAGIAGFAEACNIYNESDNLKMKELRDYLINKILKEINEVKLNGSKTNRLCNNISITIKKIEGEAVLLHLNDAGIAVSTGSACSSHDLKPSHVLTAIGVVPPDSHGSIRISLSKYTTRDELDYFVKNLKETVEKLRKISPL